DQRSRLARRPGGRHRAQARDRAMGGGASVVPRWMFGLPFSIALHAALAVALIGLVRMASAPPGLLVDLTAIVAGRETGTPSASGAAGGGGPLAKAKHDGGAPAAKPRVAAPHERSLTPF